MKIDAKTIFLSLLTCSISIFAQLVAADNPGDCTGGLRTVNDSSNTCYTFTPERIEASDVTVDANLSDTAWSSATSKTLDLGMGVDPNLVLDATVNYLFADDFLILSITILDDSPNDGDYVSIFIDPIHSASATPEGDEFRFLIFRDQRLRKTPLAGGQQNGWPVNDERDSVGSEVALLSSDDEWIIELKIHKADLGLSGGVTDLPPLIGIAVYARSPSNFLGGKWPNENFDPFDRTAIDNPSTWANLKTRFPLEYMIVLDQSGSMLSDNKWENATAAANYLANTMSVFADTTYFPDELGITTFAWDCDGEDLSTVVDVSDDGDGDGDELEIVRAFPVGDYVDSLQVPAPDSGNCTPIGSGVNKAFEAVGTSAEDVNRVLLVLSDGLHNRPNSDLALSELDYEPCNRAGDNNTENNNDWSVCDASDIQINTIAFGEDGRVDEMLLNNISNYYQGDFGTATYNITSDPSALKAFFIQSLDDLFQLNLLAINGSDFDVDPNNAKLVVIAAWDTTPGDAAEFDLSFDADGNGTFDAGEVRACNTSAADTSVGFAICVIDNPEGGIWRANAAGADQLFPLLDLNLRARFAVDQAVHGTGSAVVLTVDLNEAGLPLTHDPVNHPVSVSVNIRRPVEGLGDLISSHNLTTCAPQEPELPPIYYYNQRHSALTPPESAASLFPLRNIASQVDSKALAAANGDPAPGLFQLSSLYFDNCDAEGISLVEDIGVALLDNGSNGDVQANDGIYTLAFNGSEFEGSYVFEFNANGTSLAGENFERTKTIAAYIRVEVDANNTEFDFRDIPVSSTLTYREYFVIPQDSFGRYLGPGRTQFISFQVYGASAAGSIVDYGNGIYSQFFSFNPQQGEPEGTVLVQGKPVEPKVDLPAICDFGYYTTWNNGFVGYVNITNTSNEDINGWDLSWQFSNSQTIFNAWNTYLQGNNPYTASNLSYNARIRPGETIGFGFEGRKIRHSSVEIPKLSGSVCSTD